jgi:ElaB/YqjD/DUF883 family membrane-anchored ribosome-binding protein
MEELIHKIVGSTGITGEQAKKAIETVSEELKSKFPTLLHSEIDNVINGGKFGNTYRDKAEQLRDKIEEVAKEAGSRAETVFGEVREKFNEMFSSNKTTGNGK